MRLALLLMPIVLLGLMLLEVWVRQNPHTDFSSGYWMSLYESYSPLMIPALFAAQSALMYFVLRPVLARKEVVEARGADAEFVSASMPDEESPKQDQINTEWILDALAGGVITVSPQGKIIYMNASAEKLTLWPREKSLGMPVAQVLKVEDLQGESVLERAFDTLKAQPDYPLQFGQVRLFPRTGGFRFVELNTASIYTGRKAIAFVFRDVTADRKLMNRLYRQASRDALTGLMNRTSFEQYVEQVAHDTSGLARSHVLASIDLDNFKIVNDTCGHMAGDELLKQVAQIFQRQIRQSDKVARMGGDEFAIFLEGCGLGKGRNIMEAVLTELRNYRFSWDGKVFTIGASIGMLEFMPSPRIQIKQLFADADKASYTAKALGRNQVFVHTDKEVVEKNTQQINDWGKLLKNAIQDDRFVLFAQPIVPLHKTGANQKHRHYEILLRLPFRQALLNPGSFLPAAGRLDMMADIDRWTISKALTMLSGSCRSKPEESPANHLMINLSEQSVKDSGLLQFIEQQLKAHKVKPEVICFEISESVAIGHFIHVKRLMGAIRALGCHLVLDDFGSGFSSLNYLRELPLSYLKIDGNFVHNLVSNPVDAAMVKAVHEVGRVMNLATIAELVEDGETLQHLRQIGVDFAQGYYCGKPLPLQHICHTQKSAAAAA